jgi:hypothetical protein
MNQANKAATISQYLWEVGIYIKNEKDKHGK